MQAHLRCFKLFWTYIVGISPRLAFTTAMFSFWSSTIVAVLVKHLGFHNKNKFVEVLSVDQKYTNQKGFTGNSLL